MPLFGFRDIIYPMSGGLSIQTIYKDYQNRAPEGKE